MRTFDIDAYPDADFAGLYEYEDSLGPICVRSHTGFVINVASCPVMWKAVLQSKATISTTETKVIALAAWWRELMPIIDTIDEVGKAVGLSLSEKTNLHIVIHEDNTRALILAQWVPPQFTPWSKHYAVKMHWCHQSCIAWKIVLHKTSTTEQL